MRPWIQNRSNAQVAINRRATLTPYVRASPQTFDLRPGSRGVRLTMRRTTASGSLYGGIQVFARQKLPKLAQRDHPAVRPRQPAAAQPAHKRPNLKIGSTACSAAATPAR